MKQLALLLSVFVLAFQSGRPTESALPPKPDHSPKNIILLIGDGMGLTQITAGMYASANPLNLERFPITGLVKTHSAKNLITDSAASATAFGCGCKTYNGAIGVNTKKNPCPSILEQAEAFGLATGLVATSSITHATPASFIAHVEQRSLMQDIALDFLKTDIDLVIGGGMRYFTQRSDNRNLLEEFRAKGYVVSDYTIEPLQQCTVSTQYPFMWFSAVGEPESVLAGRDYLPAAARLAPEFLAKRSEKGFFLMLEGSQIDWACHDHDSERAIQEMLDFDKAIGEVLRFAEKDGNTLVIVTADHETGGMALLRGADKSSLKIEFTTDYHTASMVPIFAYGPGAEKFGGLYDNTEIYFKMRDLFRFPEVNSK
jgi:alkaline phosphatase